MADTDIPNSMDAPEGRNLADKMTARAREVPVQIADYYDIAQKAKTDAAGQGKVYFGRDKRTMQYYALKTYQGKFGG